MACLPVRPLSCFQRILFLGFVLASELIGFSVWLDTSVLSSQHGLIGAIGDWGPPLARVFVVFAIAFLTLAGIRSKTLRLADLTDAPVSWRMVAAHVAALCGFGILSASFFSATALTSCTAWLALLWLAIGLFAVSLITLALIPARVWLRIIFESGSTWCYAATAAAVVYSVAPFGGLLWAPTTELTFKVVKLILTPFIPGLIADSQAKIIGSSTFTVNISPQCSGLEGVALMVAFGAVWLAFFRREYRFPHALALIPVGVSVLWVLNSFRIAALVLIGNAGAPGIAMGGFHSQAGWIAFNAVAVGLSMAGRRISWLRRDQSREALARNPVAPYLAPFLALLVGAMISRAATSNSFEWLYPVRFLAAAAAIWWFRNRYVDLDWRAGWMAAVAGVGVLGMWLGLERWSGSHALSTIPAGLQAMSASGRSAWLSIRVIAATSTVPIAEELAFRGFLIRRLISSDFESLSVRRYTLLAIAGSSLAFGLLHGDRWIAGTVAGLIYAGVFLRRGRIGDAVVAHAVTNGLLAIWVLWRGDWGLW